MRKNKLEDKENVYKNMEKKRKTENKQLKMSLIKKEKKSSVFISDAK